MCICSFPRLGVLVGGIEAPDVEFVGGMGEWLREGFVPGFATTLDTSRR